ncbi:MAG: prolipoprotein diacylglyceryl transferase family protein [Gemmatimonadota bacterium]
MIIAHPLNFHTPAFLFIKSFEITGYGVMMMCCFVIGGWLIDRECRRNRFAPDYAGDMIMAAVVGGIVGAKLWYVALHGVHALFARGGLVYYGGFVGGTLAVILNGWRRGVPLRWTAQLAAPALAAAYAVGRVGCYLVGDDYGRPTSLPWAVAFPEGLPRTTAGSMQAEFGLPIPPGATPDTLLAVHPTQLYEVALMLVVFALLWRWRAKQRGTGWLFGAYLIFAGSERFLVEIFRAKDDRFVAGLTLAQLFSVLLVLLGSALLSAWSPQGRLAPGPWLETGKTPLDSPPRKP